MYNESVITAEQEKWLNHLSNTDRITIIPYDPTTPQKFEKVKTEIQAKLGDVEVAHCGATSLGISGQDEIDVYIPSSPDTYDAYLVALTDLYGQPRTHHPLERSRFVTNVDDKHVTVSLMNQERDGWKNMVKFQDYLRTHPEALDTYRKLKEEGNGLSTREYYRRKVEFLNYILAQS